MFVWIYWATLGLVIFTYFVSVSVNGRSVWLLACFINLRRFSVKYFYFSNLNELNHCISGVYGCTEQWKVGLYWPGSSIYEMSRLTRPHHTGSKWQKQIFFPLKGLDKKRYFVLNCDLFFILNQTNISHLINQALVILYEVICVVKILEKWDIFNFADFHRILHIS